MKKSRSLGALVAILAMLAVFGFGSAQAAIVTIGFDNLVYGSTSYTEDDFLITTNSALRTTGLRGNPAPELYAASTSQTNTLAALNGNPFDLVSIELAGGPSVGGVWPQTITFTGLLNGGGSVSQSFVVTGSSQSGITISNWQLFTFNPLEFQELLSVSWVPQYSLADNIKVAPIPVPAAVWLFGSGMIGLIGIARKRKAT